MTGEDAATDTVSRFQHFDPQTPVAEHLGARQSGNSGSYHYDVPTLVGHGSDKILADFPGCKESPNSGDKPGKKGVNIANVYATVHKGAEAVVVLGTSKAGETSGQGFQWFNA
jgi:hypothetical protein